MNGVMDDARTKEIVAALTVADVLKAYSGKPGCACGCNGKYYVTPESRREADEDRGYPHEDGDVSRAQVKRILNKLRAQFVQDHHDNDRFVAGDLYYVTCQPNEGRVYTVYLTSAARERLNAISNERTT